MFVSHKVIQVRTYAWVTNSSHHFNVWGEHSRLRCYYLFWKIINLCTNLTHTRSPLHAESIRLADLITLFCLPWYLQKSTSKASRKRILNISHLGVGIPFPKPQGLQFGRLSCRNEFVAEVKGKFDKFRVRKSCDKFYCFGFLSFIIDWRNEYLGLFRFTSILVLLSV